MSNVFRLFASGALLVAMATAQPVLAADAAAPAKKAKPTQVAANVSAKKKPAAASETMEQVQAKLVDHAHRKLTSLCANMRPSENRKDVEKIGDEYVARYQAIEIPSLETEVKDSQGAGGKYIGVFKYVEHSYENHAPTKQAALDGEFVRTKSRRITEVIRYDKGAWQD